MSNELKEALQYARDWITSNDGIKMLIQLGNPEVKAALGKIDNALAAPVASAAPSGERKAFEKLERKNSSNLKRQADGQYENPCTQSACEGWQARAAIAHQPPKEALTDTEKLMRISDAQRKVDEWAEGLSYEPSLTEVKARFFDLITAASAPNKQLVEALQEACYLIRLEVADGVHTVEYVRGLLALAAAGLAPLPQAKE